MEIHFDLNPTVFAKLDFTNLKSKIFVTKKRLTSPLLDCLTISL